MTAPALFASSRRRSARAAFALSLALLSIAADCQQCQEIPEPIRGNIDRVGDAVTFTAADDHTYVLYSNPELQHLRVFDVTIERFVRGPNVLFPASIPTGEATRRLAIAPGDPTRVYALDGPSDSVQVVRTIEDGEASFVTVGEPIITGRAPGAVAAFRDVDAVELWVTVPRSSIVQLFRIDPATAAVLSQLDITLPAGSVPNDVAVDPTGDAVVVTDAATALVHIIRRADQVLDRSLDVGGPTGRVAVGQVDSGDGIGPVALVMRRDENEIALVRLFRPGFREDRYALAGRAEVPGFPVVAYVPDQTVAPVVVCCRGLDENSTGSSVLAPNVEATAAWATVMAADGVLYHFNLAARSGDRFLVRLVDAEPLPIGPSLESGFNEDPLLWVEEDGSQTRRPTVVLTAVDNHGTPPLVPLLPNLTTLLLEWEGAPPGLAALAGNYSGGVFTAVADVEARDGRAGDGVTFALTSPPPTCPERVAATVTAVTGKQVSVDLAGDDSACVGGATGVTATFAAADTFVVTDGILYLGRLGFDLRDDPADPAPADIALDLPGAQLTLTPSAGGLPRPGSRLSVPLQANVSTMGVTLSNSRALSGFEGAALVPMALTGGLMTIPGVDEGTVVTVKRVVAATAGTSTVFPNLLFSMDEAETSLNRVLFFR